MKKLAFEEALGQLKAFEEHTRQGSGSVAKSNTDQVLLTQIEWEARQKRVSREAFRSSRDGGGCG